MNTLFSKLAWTAALLLLVFLSGIWLTRTGKPYATLPFTLHKLIALAAAVLLGIIVARVNQAAPLQASQWWLVAATFVFLLATVISGGLVSVDKAMPAFLLAAHRVLPFLTLLAIAASLYSLVLRGDWLARMP